MRDMHVGEVSDSRNVPRLSHDVYSFMRIVAIVRLVIDLPLGLTPRTAAGLWAGAFASATAGALVGEAMFHSGLPFALAGLAAGGMTRDVWRHHFGVGLSRWSAVVGPIARDILRERSDLRAPDGAPPTIERFEPIPDGITAEVWAGNNMEALRDYVEGPLTRDVNLRNRDKVRANPGRWGTVVARLVEDQRVPGKARMVLMRVDPLWETRPWPHPPGHSPLERFEGPLEFGHTRWGDRVRIPVVDVGPHILVSGDTGAGKSGGLHVILTGNWLPLNLREPTVCTILGDFKGGIELGTYKRMANGYATTVPEFVRLLRRAVMFLQRRSMEWGDSEETIRKVPAFGPDNPAVVVVVDELLPLLRDPEARDLMELLNALGRAPGGISIGATQYPTDGVVPTGIRANYGIRIAYRIGSLVEAKVQLGEDPDLTAEHGPHKIPSGDERYKGVAFLRAVDTGLAEVKTDWIDDDFLASFRAVMDDAGNPKPDTPWLDSDDWWKADPRLNPDSDKGGRGRGRGRKGIT